MKKIVITTSWDDGNKLDLKIVRLLDKYNLKGTFYIPKKSEFTSLSEKEIKEISKNHEIGAHTLNHIDLTKINLRKARQEISDSKRYLEELLGKQIKMFCYPRGEYNQKIKEIVIRNSFLGARTVKEFNFEKPDDFFEMETTLHIYPFPFRKRDKSHYHLTRFLFQPLQRKFFKILKLGLPINSFVSWSNLAKNLFDYILKNGGIYHLWGHSWEIEKYNMCKDLEEIFKYISNRENVFYLTNSQILKNS